MPFRITESKNGISSAIAAKFLGFQNSRELGAFLKNHPTVDSLVPHRGSKGQRFYSVDLLRGIADETGNGLTEKVTINGVKISLD